MMRAAYRGAVRDSDAERMRDERMLSLAEQHVSVSIIAQRMGVTVNSARMRIKRARDARAVAGVCAARSGAPQSTEDGFDAS